MTDKQLLESINQIIASQLESIKTTQQEHTLLLQNHNRILSKHSRILGEHTQILGGHSKGIKSLKGMVKKINKTLDIVIRTFDERIVTNTRDIDHIKTSLGYELQTVNPNY